MAETNKNGKTVLILIMAIIIVILAVAVAFLAGKLSAKDEEKSTAAKTTTAAASEVQTTEKTTPAEQTDAYTTFTYKPTGDKLVLNGYTIDSFLEHNPNFSCGYFSDNSTGDSGYKGEDIAVSDSYTAEMFHTGDNTDSLLTVSVRNFTGETIKINSCEITKIVITSDLLTVNGVGVGSGESDVIAALGSPNSGDESAYLSYKCTNSRAILLFSLDNDMKVDSMVIDYNY